MWRGREAKEGEVKGEGCSAGRGEGDARCLRAGLDAMVSVCGRSAGFPSCAGRRTTRVAVQLKLGWLSKRRARRC